MQVADRGSPASVEAQAMKGTRRHWLRRGLTGLAVQVALLAAFAIADGWRNFGRRAEGARGARMEASPEWRDGHFVNPHRYATAFGAPSRALFT